MREGRLLGFGEAIENGPAILPDSSWIILLTMSGFSEADLWFRSPPSCCSVLAAALQLIWKPLEKPECRCPRASGS